MCIRDSFYGVFCTSFPRRVEWSEHSTSLVFWNKSNFKNEKRFLNKSRPSGRLSSHLIEMIWMSQPWETRDRRLAFNWFDKYSTGYWIFKNTKGIEGVLFWGIPRFENGANIEGGLVWGYPRFWMNWDHFGFNLWEKAPIIWITQPFYFIVYPSYPQGKNRGSSSLFKGLTVLVLLFWMQFSSSFFTKFPH